jgi:hypothetical protein
VRRRRPQVCGGLRDRAGPFVAFAWHRSPACCFRTTVSKEGAAGRSEAASTYCAHHAGRPRSGRRRTATGCVRCCRRRDAASGCANHLAPLPAGDGGPEGEPSVSRRSPRLRVVARGHHEVRAISAAPRAAKPQLGQRHVAAPSLDERPQVSVGLVAAGVAEHQHTDVAGAQRGTRCRQAISPDTPSRDVSAASASVMVGLLRAVASGPAAITVPQLHRHGVADFGTAGRRRERHHPSLCSQQVLPFT